jgi:simple sugar transport system ATP-binding protein
MKIKEQKKEAARLMREHMGYTSSAITVNTEVRNLSGGEKQGIAISRAIFFNADLVILDEPTVALSLTECAKVQEFVQKIKELGHSAIYISHNMHYLYGVCDRFIVMDRGKIAGIIDKKEVTREELENRMMRLAATGKLQ